MRILSPVRKRWVVAGLAVSIVAGGCQSFTGGNGKNVFGKKGPGRNGLMPESSELLDPLGARNPERMILQDLAPGQIGTTFKTMGFKKVDQDAAKAAYEAGQQLYQQALQLRDSDPEDKTHLELLEDAANQFRLAGHKWPDSAVHQDALFFQGESYFFCNRYVQANRAYEALIAQYSGSRYFDRAEERRFSIARYWLGRAREEKGVKSVAPGDPSRPATGMAGEARRILHRIRLDDPTGKLADDATMQLAAAFMEARLFQDAADAFEDLRRSYPGSPHMYNAHLFELKCRMNCYYGRSYEAEPLVKADQLLRQIVQQFPNQATDQEEYLAKEASRIRHMLAEREYSMGEYYENRGENRAAQLVYQDVREKFPDTEYASAVDGRIEAVSDGPPLPPQQAQWLVDLFPKSEAAKPLIAAGDREGILR